MQAAEWWTSIQKEQVIIAQSTHATSIMQDLPSTCLYQAFWHESHHMS